MKTYFGACLALFVFMNNISYGQSYECDNNFEECGTPDQSGGGGGGNGVVLIANTDLGDSYQHADDYDDDGIEDPNDNCLRYPNPQQYDRDGDGRGDMCDNCLYDWNPNQEDRDGDNSGDVCDDDIDNDQILNSADDCPYHWGNSSCFNDYSINQTESSAIKDVSPLPTTNASYNLSIDESCNQINIRTNFIYSILFLFIMFYRKRLNKA
tara:strand:- start:177 stop:806 length:630 start_codon:yes stop_codon:yes gene_type:complete